MIIIQIYSDNSNNKDEAHDGNKGLLWIPLLFTFYWLQKLGSVYSQFYSKQVQDGLIRCDSK